MSKEDFFTCISLSHKNRLLSSVSQVSGLHDYCRSHHVAYVDFTRWEFTHDVAAGILEIERRRKRFQKEKTGVAVPGCPVSPVKPETAQNPLLHPLHIISGYCTGCIESVVVPSLPSGSSPGCKQRRFNLRVTRITFPNGVKVSVRGLISEVFILLFMVIEPVAAVIELEMSLSLRSLSLSKCRNVTELAAVTELVEVLVSLWRRSLSLSKCQ